jgi:formate/nitrite transporter FocA (FNT family)
MIKKGILASIFISFGVTVSLTLGNPLGAILFSFGLLCVCGFNANLFTGKAGYLWRTEKLKLF